jgi:hypothetical protein
MTLIRKLALALCLALLCSVYSNAQVDSTTGNLINYGTTPTDTSSKWNNGVYVNSLGCFGGNTPGYCGPYPNVQTNGSINFSYGQVDLNQVININRALAAGGSGVQLSGFNFSFTAKNGNGWDDGRQDYLSAYVKFFDANGGLAANYDYTSQTNRQYGWTNFSFSETFANSVAASAYSNAQVGFVGRDNNYWAGPYGPEIRDVGFSLKYKTDPCVTNPAYSPSCAGFNAVVTSNNILPQPDAWGQSLIQISAINQALKNGGIGAQIHGINYSFDWTIGNAQSGTDSSINVNVRMNTAANSLLLNRTHSFSGQNISGHVEDKYLLPTSLHQTALGSVGMASSGWGNSSAGNFRASLIYTPDPCVADPLYSTTCTGYSAAYAKNMLASLASYSKNNSAGASNIYRAQTEQQSSMDPAQDSAQNTTISQSTESRTDNTDSGNSSGPGNLAMSVLKSSQEKDKATKQMAVQNASKALETATQSSQASSNAAIVANQESSAASGSISAAMALSGMGLQVAPQTNQQQQQQTVQPIVQIQQTSKITDTQGQPQESQSSFALITKSPTTLAAEVPQQTISLTVPMINRNLLNYNSSPTVNDSAAATAQPSQPLTQSRVDSSQQTTADVPAVTAGSGNVSRTGNPLSEIITQQPFELLQNNIAAPASSVNRNVQPNDLAVGIDIASMSSVPVGFNSYSFVLKDASFYAPKEIYKNQTTVDNVRVLRQLSSDKLHQQLINSQYKE